MNILEVAKKISSDNREENYEIHFREVTFFYWSGPDFKKWATTLLFL